MVKWFYIGIYNIYIKCCIYTEEFAAHNANVTCLALGQKSGLVLATGGADNKVNLWKVDSETCFMVIFIFFKMLCINIFIKYVCA